MSNDVKKEISTKCKAYYMKGANINWSFKTLENEALQMGARLENGDVLVVDNVNGDKRKLFKKTKSGAIIVYARLMKDIFTEMNKITNSSNALEFFNYEK